MGNGDGEGAEGKFLSLYVKILPGDYDNLLEWPFTHPIKFTLVDQSGAGRHSSSSATATTVAASPASYSSASSSAASDLQYPVHHKLRHIEERFDPDPNWKTFQKPT